MSACIIHHSITSKCIISLWVHAILMQALQQKDQASNIFITEKWKYGSDKCKCFISSYFLNFIWINHFWILWIISENDTILLFWIFVVVSDCWPLEFFDLFVFLTFFFNFWPFVLLTFKYHDFLIDLFFLPFYLLTFKYYDFLTLLFISIWPLHLSTERSNWNRQKGQKIVIFKGQKVKKKRSIKKS